MDLVQELFQIKKTLFQSQVTVVAAVVAAVVVVGQDQQI